MLKVMWERYHFAIMYTTTILSQNISGWRVTCVLVILPLLLMQRLSLRRNFKSTLVNNFMNYVDKTLGVLHWPYFFQFYNYEQCYTYFTFYVYIYFFQNLHRFIFLTKHLYPFSLLICSFFFTDAFCQFWFNLIYV